MIQAFAGLYYHGVVFLPMQRVQKTMLKSVGSIQHVGSIARGRIMEQYKSSSKAPVMN